MLQVKTGRTGALATLFERHHGKIYHFCYRMTGNQATSQDLVQDVFMRALKYRKTFREDSKFTPWLYRMARNACIDQFRKSGREPLLPGEMPEPASTEPSAADLVETGEDVERLHTAMSKLPDDKREILILSRFEFRRHAEIAEMLDCSVGAVKVRVHRALSRLREIYLDLAREGSPMRCPDGM